jgi:hypothetical protein
VTLCRVKSVKVAHVSTQLLNGTSAECVTGSNEHPEVVLDQPEADLNKQIRIITDQIKKFWTHFSEVGRFANAVDTAESHDKRSTLTL